MRVRFRSLALVAGLLPLGASAQTALTPGHPDLTAAAPQSVEYDIQIAGDTPRRIGHFTRTETLDGDRLVIASHVEIPARGQDQRDTTVVTWPGLAPVSRSLSDGEETVRMSYANGRLTGRSVLGNLDEALDAPVPAGAFGEGLSWRIARSVPLRDGYTATFQSADKYGDLSTGTVTVAGHEGDVWAVTVAIPGDPTYTHTVDGATRNLLKASFSPQANLTVEYAPPPPRAAGPVLRPGDPALDTSWMRDQTTRYVIRLVEPMQMDAGTTTSTRTVANGVVTVTTTVSVPAQNMTVTSTATADAATLAPVATTTAGGPSATAVTYSPGHVAGTKTPASGDAAPVSADLEAPVFDATWSMEVAQSLPLEAGYTATAETYDADQGLQTVTYTVAGPEDMGGVAMWTVTAVGPAGPVTYHIDGATRHVLSMRMSPQPGMTVEMAPAP